jgi:hypothetical protein
MERFEANLDGTVEAASAFTDFDELRELGKVFIELNWKFRLLHSGRGGYSLFEIEFPDNHTAKIHIYLKKVTFGGRENRPFEKRAQFSAALDRGGFFNNENETEEEFSLILGIYKRNKFSKVVLCAWDIHDWGKNIGRAFNCFVDVHVIAMALRDDFAQHKTSVGQIVCCFTPSFFYEYLNNRKELHSNVIKGENKQKLLQFENFENDNDYKIYLNEVPSFSDLFEYVIKILINHNGITSIDTIELEVADALNLTENARLEVHNKNEGNRTKLGYQLAWARYYLKRANYIYSPSRGIWALTDYGLNNPVNKTEIISAATQQQVQADFKEDELNVQGSETEIENEIDIENTTIENPFDPNKVDIRTRTMSLDLILKRLKTDAIEMQTSFQRKANLWSITKQSRLIESILVKFPLPAFYFDGSNDSKWLVVDGLQRLSSLNNFVNLQAFALKNMEFLQQFNDKKFNELPSYLQRRIEEFEITAYVISAGTPKELKFNVFKRINTGGLTLTTQEIRNALYQGRATEFIKKLADLKSFKVATSYTISEDRMADQEFVTRFLAFYLFPLEAYNSDLDSFLNMAMEYLNKLNTDLLMEHLPIIKSDFDKAMNTAIMIFENDAFRKRFHRDDNRKPINKALFEVWSVLLSKLSDRQISRLIDNKMELQNNFILQLNNDDEFHKAITSGTGDKSRIRKRFKTIESIIQTTLAE